MINFQQPSCMIALVVVAQLLSERTLQLDYACELWTLRSRLSRLGDISDWIRLQVAGSDENETESNLLI